LSDKVNDLGYEVVGMEKSKDGVEKTTISVGGMTCAACVRRVESALEAIDGVKDAAVNLSTARATVIHEPGWAGVEALRRVISDAGYEFLGVVGKKIILIQFFSKA
jgi:Cu+-exporting ATPase